MQIRSNADGEETGSPRRINHFFNSSLSIVKTLSFLAILLLITSPALAQSELAKVHGKIVGSNAKNIADVRVSSLWRLEVNKMKPLDEEFAKSSVNGDFELGVTDRALAVVAIDDEQKHGALVSLDSKNRTLPLEVVLRPLVTVKVRFPKNFNSCRIKSFHMYVEMPEVEERPLALTKLVYCESETGEFELKLPPGDYVLDVYAFTDEERSKDLDLQPKHRVSVGAVSSVDLGTLTLTVNPNRPESLGRLLRKAHASESWTDVSKRIGTQSPDWHVTDSQGLGAKHNVADFRGKWLLVEFWSLGCAPCVKSGMPDLMDFYERNKNKRDRFEIVAVYIDYTSEFGSITDLNRALEPVKKHVWAGRELSFPLILDSSFKTWENFGLQGFGQTVLIDPSGRIVDGGIAKLDAILN